MKKKIHTCVFVCEGLCKFKCNLGLCSCMRSLRDPLLEAELRESRQLPLWLFAEEIMVSRATAPPSLYFSKSKKQI